MTSSSPRGLDYALGGFALLLAVGNAVSVWNGEAFWEGGGRDPFADYRANLGIRAIAAAALVTNLMLAGAVLVWRLRRQASTATRALLFMACVVGATLPWLELWWGSTFYYGEVRDKQGLPYGVTNIGPLGSILLLGYIAGRVPLPIMSMWKRLSVRVALVVGIYVVQRVLLKVAEVPWNLSQS